MADSEEDTDYDALFEGEESELEQEVQEAPPARKAAAPKTRKPRSKYEQLLVKTRECTRLQASSFARAKENTRKQRDNPLVLAERPAKRARAPARRDGQLGGNHGIFINQDDVERRALLPHECKIDRRVWIRQTRFYPYGRHLDTHTFYTTPAPKDLACWWCTLLFPPDTIPLPLAIRYSASLGGFYTQGQFCTASCMLAEAYKRDLGPVARNLLKKVYGVSHTETLVKAPSRLILEKFGGAVSESAYRKTLLMGPRVSFTETTPPMIPWRAGLEEVERLYTVISEYGDENKVQKVIQNATRASATPIQQASRPMQRSVFAKMPTLEEQLALGRQQFRLKLGGQPEKRAGGLKSFLRVRKQS
jgi:hypothetical protein